MNMSAVIAQCSRPPCHYRSRTAVLAGRLFTIFPNRLLTLLGEMFTINPVAVPATFQVRRMSFGLQDRSQRRCFSHLAMLCALVLTFFASNTARAGFCLSLEVASGSESRPVDSKETPDPTSPSATEFHMHPRDADTGSTSGGPATVGLNPNGLCALPGASFELNHPELNGWLFRSKEFRLPIPIPSGIFHPPRSIR